MRVSYPWALVVLKIIFEPRGQDAPDDVVSQPIYPIEVIVENNSYNEADTAKTTINFNEFPLDPRLMKSCAMQVHMGTLQKPSDKMEVSEETLQFVGFVDVPTMEFDDSNMVVRLEARDFTALLIDTKIGDVAIDLRVPLDEAIRSILALDPAFEEIEVELRGIDEAPTLSGFKSDWNHQDASQDGESYWDKIVDLVQQSGLICFIEKDKLVITEAQNLTDDSKVELFIYGKNLKSLRMARDLVRQESPNIEVRSYDDKKKVTLIGRYPKEPVKKKRAKQGLKKGSTSSSSGEKSTTVEFQRFIVKNINTVEQLEKIAKSIYFSLIRTQVTGTIQTDETKTIVEGEDTSMMSLRHGMAAYIGVDMGSGLYFHSMTRAQKVKKLQDLGYEPETSESLAAMFDSDKLNGPFYIKKATHTFKNDDGYSLSADFMEFIDPDTAIEE